MGRAAGLRYLWLHDEIRPETVPAAVLPLLHGAMARSTLHPTLPLPLTLTTHPNPTPTPTPTPNPNPNQVLSAFHGSQLPKHAAPYAFRTANGLDPAAIVDGPNARDRFIYASSASAGLLLLLQAGPNPSPSPSPNPGPGPHPHPSP